MYAKMASNLRAKRLLHTAYIIRQQRNLKGLPTSGYQESQSAIKISVKFISPE